MKRLGRHAVACLAFAIVAAAMLGIAACSGGDAGKDNDGGPVIGAANATLEVTATLDGRDVTEESAGVVAATEGDFASELQAGSEGLGAKLAPGKYQVLVTFQGDSGAGLPPMKVLEVDVRGGKTTHVKAELDRNVSMSTLQLMQQLTMKAVMQQARALGASAGAAAWAGGSQRADPARLAAFAACAGLPGDYFGNGQDIPSAQLDDKPEFQFAMPAPVSMPAPARANPMQAAFQALWSRTLQSAAVAEAVETTLDELRVAIAWADMDAAGKLVGNLAKLLPRMAAAGKASRQAEADLLRIEIAPLLANNPPALFDVDDPVGMQQAFLAAQQELERNGLPAATVAKLRNAGWTDKQIAAMTANAIHAPAGEVVSQTIVGAALGAAAIRRDAQVLDTRAAAARAELDKLQKGVTHCGQSR